MHCPFCMAVETKVVDSRLSNEGEAVRRRRECLTCGDRFTTFETVELVLPHLVKRDGSRVPFDQDKLRNGILKALEKRPVSIDIVDKSLADIIKKVHAFGEREIQSQQLGEWVMDELKKMDQVAYVRFASVYRSFQDLDEFRNEIEKLIKH
jgi:transcriptional repressor NrdR